MYPLTPSAKSVVTIQGFHFVPGDNIKDTKLGVG